ncbi:MAG: cysteine desulfurase [Rikenellaceae bacterium]|nr:cysteine desulfurase [Rikenellaceae bacterium]
MFDADKIRKDFPILNLKVHGKPLVYFDNGATAQKPLRVIEKINSLHLESNANIHRGLHYLSEKITSEYEEARKTIAGFINARSGKEVVFTSGATMSINTVAYSYGEKFVSEGDNVIVSEMEHHSNIVPWQMLCQRKNTELRVIPFDDEGYLREDRLEGLIDNKTRIVAVTQASNVLGTMPDLDKIIKLSHNAGVPVLIDGCQGIVHADVDVQALDCDFYVFSGHKLYGPTGIGILYAKEKWLEEMPPFMGGGDMVKTVSFEKTEYADIPLKFEAGTSNFIGAIGMAEAVKYLSSIDFNAVRLHEYELTNYASDQLQNLDGVKIYGNVPDKCSIISFTVEGTHPYDIGMILDKMGVAIRTGTHCAEPVMAHYGLQSMARASFAMYNTFGEIDIFVDSLEKTISMLRG